MMVHPIFIALGVGALALLALVAAAAIYAWNRAEIEIVRLKREIGPDGLRRSYRELGAGHAGRAGR